MKMSNNPAKYEVLIKQYLRSILDISDRIKPKGSELHASPHIHIWIGHIHIWIGHNHIWIYMDKTIWECALYVG